MMTANQKTFNQFSHILMLSAWGIAMVICSFLFLYVGYKLDRIFNTEPNFMLGLFLLGLFISMARLYQDAWARRKKM